MFGYFTPTSAYLTPPPMACFTPGPDGSPQTSTNNMSEHATSCPLTHGLAAVSVACAVILSNWIFCFWHYTDFFQIFKSRKKNFKCYCYFLINGAYYHYLYLYELRLNLKLTLTIEKQRHFLPDNNLLENNPFRITQSLKLIHLYRLLMFILD